MSEWRPAPDGWRYAAFAPPDAVWCLVPERSRGESARTACGSPAPSGGWPPTHGILLPAEGVECRRRLAALAERQGGGG